MLSKSTRYLSIKGEAVGVCVWRKFGGGERERVGGRRRRRRRAFQRRWESIEGSKYFLWLATAQ